ncbi:MAG: FMN reductase [Candidatus Hydrogenedens sp.]|nr:FMN reductase [Candidatus Hydrogenedens sp.]
MAAPRILAFAGSARKDSFNKKLVAVAAVGAREAGAEVTLIDLADYPMPIYDGDLEASDGLPENAVKLKALFMEADALLISCPEYNGGITPLLKNVIDWVSRRQGDEGPLACYTGKTAALISASPGALGGLRGLVQVRQILSNIQVLVLANQRAVSKANEAFDAEGNLKDEKVAAQVKGLGAELAETTRKLLG